MILFVQTRTFLVVCMGGSKMIAYIPKNQAWAVVKIIARHADAHSIAIADKALADMPAADVAPVVNAYWRGIEGDGYDPDGNIVWDTFECSNCGEEHHADGEPEWDYCPSCGARMDGEEECQ